MESTELLAATDQCLAKAADYIRAGQLVAFPTETVYGLGADATSDDAVARVFEAKARPTFNPLIVHVASLDEAENFAHFNQAARMLGKVFWPGPLTLVLPIRSDARVSKLALAGADTIALRVPRAPIAQKLLLAVGRPIAAPSANPSGKISPTSAAHVLRGLAGRIAAIVDGGACPVGLESTVISTGVPPALLRQGGLAQAEIERVLGVPLALPDDADGAASPGRDLSHYAPDAALRMNATEARNNEVLLGFGAIDGTENLSPDGDLTQAAANLFRLLHVLNGLGRPIAVAPVPEEGLGLAINDRLRRASGQR
ncbi:MAG: L-threonylcarbamoyladenylate synthase [Pseudomonadota bacterium]